MGERSRGRMNWQRAASAGLVRGEQPFPPPTKKPRQVPRFLIPTGTLCAIAKVADGQWKTYRTTHENGFERFERFVKDESGSYYEFRADGGWLMLVKARFVKKRS